MVRRISAISILIFLSFTSVAAEQSPEPPLADGRLAVNTLLREDIFAGIFSDDAARLARGERNIELLLEGRPAQKGNLLAWKGFATLYRATRAHETNHPDEFKLHYQQALDSFKEARKSTTSAEAIAAIVGGALIMLGDRLPKDVQPEAYAEAYDAFAWLWKRQARVANDLPEHFRGELLGGMAQSAQRTGRADESRLFVDKIIATLPETRYAEMARQWKANPESAATTRVACQGCHEAGRLSVRLAALHKKK